VDPTVAIVLPPALVLLRFVQSGSLNVSALRGDAAASS
jgi:hypothetical protein